MRARRVVVWLGLVGWTAVAVAVGCGGDDAANVVGDDGGTDATTGNDATPLDTGAPDTGTDAGSDVVQGVATCTSPIDGGCVCDGSACTCVPGQTCNLGAVDGGDAGTGAVTYSCSSNNTCNVACGTGCTTQCAGTSTCNQTCTSECVSTCAGGSTCNLDAGVDSSVTCTGGSDCNVAIGAGSTLTCSGTTACHVACPAGGCTMQCSDPAATCVLTCGAAPCTYQCTGGAPKTCGAGTTCGCGDAGLDGGSD
jgi:hypothetical protein